MEADVATAEAQQRLTDDEGNALAAEYQRDTNRRDLFARLEREHRVRLWWVARRIMSTNGFYDADVDDVVQEAFLRINTAFLRGQFHPDVGSFGAWATRIAINCALSWLRHDRRRRALTIVGPVPEVPDRSPDQLRTAMVSRALDAAARELETMPANHRVVLTLRHVYGLSTKETAHALGIPLGTEYVWEHRARCRLRDAVEPLLPPLAA